MIGDDRQRLEPSITLTNSGSMSGVAVGGTGNSVTVATQGDVYHQQLAAELQELLRQLHQGRLDEEETRDLERLEEAAERAGRGEIGAARRSLVGVGGWVSEVARRVGASLVTKELEQLLA